jgi:hypothetical protein
LTRSLDWWATRPFSIACAVNEPISSFQPGETNRVSRWCRGESSCKPASVPGVAAIHLGPALPPASSGPPGDSTGPASAAAVCAAAASLIRPCSGWGVPSRPVTRPLVRSYRTVSPLPPCVRSAAVCSLWHGSCGSPRLAVGQHPALRRPEVPRSRVAGTAATRPTPCTSLLTRACGPPARRVTCWKGPEPGLVDDVVLVRRLIVQHRRLTLDWVDRGWRSGHGHPAFLSFLSRSRPLGAVAASCESSIATRTGRGRSCHPSGGVGLADRLHGSPPKGERYDQRTRRSAEQQPRNRSSNRS